MAKMWLGMLVWLSVPVLCLAQPRADARFRQVALLILEQKLEKTGTKLSGEVLNQIAKETDLPPTEVRFRLSALLDTLEVQRQHKTEVWQRLVQTGGKQVPPQTTEKFLRQLMAEARKLVNRQADYELQLIVNWAAQKAQISPYQAKDLLLQVLSLGSRSSMPRLAGIPGKIGLLVDVQTRTEEQAAATDIPNSIRPLLLQELPSSPRIKWAVDKPTPSQEPDYQLVVTFDDFQDSPEGNRGDRLQTRSLSLDLALKSVAGQTQVYHRPLTVNQYVHVDSGNPRPIEAFYAEVTLKIRNVLDDYLSAR